MSQDAPPIEDAVESWEESGLHFIKLGNRVYVLTDDVKAGLDKVINNLEATKVEMNKKE